MFYSICVELFKLCVCETVSFLHYYIYICGCELVCDEVVKYYHGLQLLVLLSFVYVFSCTHVGFLLDGWV